MKNEVRPIDGNGLVNSLKNMRLHILLENENNGAAVFDDIMDLIKHEPEIHVTPKGDPLTLEELRQMDGKPVWCVDKERYGLVSVESGGMWDGVPFFLSTENGIPMTLNVEQRGLTLHKVAE